MPIRTIYGSGNRSKAEQMINRVKARYRSLAGFENAHFMVVDGGSCEVGKLVAFDSKPRPEAAVAATRQQLQKRTGELRIQRQGAPEHRIVELYEAMG